MCSLAQSSLSMISMSVSWCCTYCGVVLTLLCQNMTCRTDGNVYRIFQAIGNDLSVKKKWNNVKGADKLSFCVAFLKLKMHDNQITVTILVHRKNGTITPQQQTTFENIVTKDEIAFDSISSFLPRLKMVQV